MISLQRQRLLIIAPHPDDEVIGCGGLIQKVKAGGGQVFVLFLTVGDTHDFSKKGLSTQSSREEEIENVAKFLKYDDYQIAFAGNEYHLKLDTLGQLALMNMIERESSVSIEKVKPSIITFPVPTSYNQDHQAAALATHAALRYSSGEKHFIKTAFSYESPADFWTIHPRSPANLFVPLSGEEYDRKIKAFKLYASQWRNFPSSRSEEVLSGLAKLRGAQSNSEFGEGYFIHRETLE